MAKSGAAHLLSKDLKESTSMANRDMRMPSVAQLSDYQLNAMTGRMHHDERDRKEIQIIIDVFNGKKTLNRNQFTPDTTISPFEFAQLVARWETFVTALKGVMDFYLHMRVKDVIGKMADDLTTRDFSGDTTKDVATAARMLNEILKGPDKALFNLTVNVGDKTAVDQTKTVILNFFKDNPAMQQALAKLSPRVKDVIGKMADDLTERDFSGDTTKDVATAARMLNEILKGPDKALFNLTVNVGDKTAVDQTKTVILNFFKDNPAMQKGLAQLNPRIKDILEGKVIDGEAGGSDDGAGMETAFGEM
jgi:hypothetical protein